ncbi:MAG: ATP-binding cassette domain-containing protein [Ruminococcaceae bacterium]|nr:ATP-binding cassette domain-containing protein [Oscillospiraceae bacterium]
MIKIQNLVKNYGSIEAVKNISFTVEEGEIVGFLGPNGAGKSTVMNILTGYLSSTSGEVEVNGVNVLENPLDAKRQIGYLPEQPPLYPDMTVKEYLGFVFDLKGCKLPKKEHLAEICEVVKIKDVYNRVIRNLSKGYRQRVGIAQALIGNPKVVIFDEPTVGLDPKQIIEIRSLIRELGRHHTVILSTHILPEVQAVCDRIVIINRGRIVANEKTTEISRAVQGAGKMSVKICGPEKDVYSALRAIPGVQSVTVLGAQDADSITYYVESERGLDIRKVLFRTVAQKGWTMIGMEAMGVNLEDIFLSVVEDPADATAKKKNRKGGNV